MHNKINSGTKQHTSLTYNVLALKGHLQGEQLISVEVIEVMKQLYPTPNAVTCYTLLKKSFNTDVFSP
jgi:hypothetical protein